MQDEKEDMPAPVEGGHDLYEAGIVLTNGGWSKGTWVHRFEMVHNMIRPSRVRESRQHQSLEQRGAGHRAKSPVCSAQQSGNGSWKNWHKKAQAWGVWNSLKHLSKFADFKQRATTKAVVARMRGSIRDDFQVQMKTKDRAWQRIGGLESRFNEIRLKHPIRYIQWISRLCLHKRYVLTQKKGVWLFEFNFAIMKVFAFSL